MPVPRAVRVLGLAAALLCACSATQTPLNSDRIEARFGSYGVEVLASDAVLRRASLYSVHDGQRICRTYAIVRWHPLPADGQNHSLAAAHDRVLAGASLGETLRAAGWTIDKRTRLVGSLPAITPTPEWLSLMSVRDTSGLAVHVYDISLRKSQKVIEYATIVEVHHPEYMDTEALADLYVVRPGDALDSASRDELLRLLAEEH